MKKVERVGCSRPEEDFLLHIPGGRPKTFSIHPTSCSQLRPLLTSSVHFQVFRLGRLIGSVAAGVGRIEAVAIGASGYNQSIRVMSLGAIHLEPVCRQPDTGDPARQRKLVDRTHTHQQRITGNCGQTDGFR